MENNIQFLSEIIDQYEEGTLDMTQLARKCYISEREKHFGRTSWVHNDELKNHSILRSMGKDKSKDLLRQTKEKL